MTAGTKAAIAVAAVASALAFGSVIVGVYHVGRARAAAYDADTARTNAMARADRTRHSLLDSLELAERLAQQRRISIEDALSRLARAEGSLITARGRITVLEREIATVRDRPTTARADTAGGQLLTIASRDSVDTLGVRAVAEASVRGLPLPADFEPPPTTWSWRITQRAIAFNVQVTCLERQATVRVTSPSGLRLELDELEQDPAACAPAPELWQPWSLRLPSLPMALLLFAGGVLAGVTASN